MAEWKSPHRLVALPRLRQIARIGERELGWYRRGSSSDLVKPSRLGCTDSPDNPMVRAWRRHAAGRPRAALRRRQARRRTTMRKLLPEKMFIDAEQSRLSALRTWVLDQQVTEIEMNERQFWNFATLQQPPTERPWTTFMGR